MSVTGPELALAIARADRAAVALRRGRLDLKSAMNTLLALTHTYTRTLDTTSVLACHNALLAAVLEQRHLIARPAAARAQLAGDGLEPIAPPVDGSDVATYARHGWLMAHAELGSPGRWTRKAVNRWAVHHGVRPGPLWGQARDEMPHWAAELRRAAEALPTGHQELLVAAPGARGLTRLYPGSHLRPLLFHAVVLQAVHRAGHNPCQRYSLFGDRHGGLARLVVPAPWAHWLCGPVHAHTLRAGAVVIDPQGVAAHEVAFSLWDRGTRGITYADALAVAGDILLPPAAAEGPHPAGSLPPGPGQDRGNTLTARTRNQPRMPLRPPPAPSLP